jgi:hypothetical protein
MNDAPPLPPEIDYQPPSRPEGMSSGAKWGIGCAAGCLLTLLIASLIGYFIWVKAKEFGLGLLNQYTSETPVAFEDPVADPAVVEALKARFDAFSDAMKTGGETGPLELTGEDVNLLIHHHPEWNDLAGKVEVAIEGDRFTGEISLPLDEMGSLLKGRYLNGKATFRLALVNGSLEGYIDDIEVANQKLPPEVMTALTSENIFKDSRHDAEFSALIHTLHELRIETGRLIIVPKPAPERQPAPADPATSTTTK